MSLYAEEALIETPDKEAECAGLQGDSLSPLLLCISLIPLTEQLNMFRTGCAEHTT